MLSSLTHDILNPRRKHRVLISHGNHEEYTRTQDIIKILGHERSDQFIFLISQPNSFLIQFSCYHLHITTIHDSLVMLMHQFHLLVLQLLVFLEELKQFIIQRSAANYLLSII